MKHSLRGVLVLFVINPLSYTLAAAPRDVSFSVPRSAVEAYDVFELSASVPSPDAANPFTDVSFEGDFSLPAAGKSWHVSGFCDSTDGSTFRLRFMPAT